MTSVVLGDFCDVLEAKIEAEYIRRNDSLGWRFLSCPKSNIDTAKVVFLGLNPGGQVVDVANDGFSVEGGSAYRIEEWGNSAAGESILQKQVLALFDLIGVKPDDVLSGNLVPFRSPRLKDLKDKKDAFVFGGNIWKMVLERSTPHLIIAIGGEASQALFRMLDIRAPQKILTGWGNVSVQRGISKYTVVIGLPHLSTFKLMSRPACVEVLERVFKDVLPPVFN